MRIPAEPSASALLPRSAALTWAGRYSTLPRRPLPTETVEFPVMHATDKCVPFVRSERQNGPFGIPAVADTDAAIG
jgi:hypothetical protein